MTPRAKIAAARLPALFKRLEGIGREIARLRDVPYVPLKRTKVDARMAFAVALDVEQWIAEDERTLAALHAEAERLAVHFMIHTDANGITEIVAVTAPPLRAA